MRFGIMAMQIGALIPSGGRPEDLLAHAIGFDHPGLIRQLHGQGFNPIELGGDLRCSSLTRSRRRRSSDWPR